MEQKHKVRLTTTSTFDLERTEIEKLYIYLSLFQYRYLRVPNYNEQTLMLQLERDFKKYLVEMQTQTERDPNNLSLNRIRTFFDIHHKKIKELVAKNYTENKQE